MKFVFERPPVAPERHEVGDGVAGNRTAVDCTEGMVKDTFDLVWIWREVFEYLRVGDVCDDGWNVSSWRVIRQLAIALWEGRWRGEDRLTCHDDVVLPHSPDGHYRHDGLKDSDIVYVLAPRWESNLLVCFSALFVRFEDAESSQL